MPWIPNVDCQLAGFIGPRLHASSAAASTSKQGVSEQFAATDPVRTGGGSAAGAAVGVVGDVVFVVGAEDFVQPAATKANSMQRVKVMTRRFACAPDDVQGLRAQS